MIQPALDIRNLRIEFGNRHGPITAVDDVSLTIAPGEILAAPAHPYTRLLLETVPDPFRPRRDRAPLFGEVPNPIGPPTGCSFHPRCPLAMPICRSELPVLRSRGSTGKVACHAAD